MPRSGPGLATARPSTSTRPVVGTSRPATMRSSVDLPHPDGPRMEIKSLSATARSTGSSARVGGRRRSPENTLETVSTTSFDMLERPGVEALVRPLEDEVRGEPDHPDAEDAEDHLAGIEQPLAVH